MAPGAISLPRGGCDQQHRPRATVDLPRRFRAHRELRHVRGALRARARAHARSRFPLGLDHGARVLRLPLLLVPPARARGERVLGGARGPPPERGVQPVDGAAPDGDVVLLLVDLLRADGGARVLASGHARGGAHRPAVPVLDPHRAHPHARHIRSHLRLAVEPPGASRGQRSLPRPQLRWPADHLGPAVRNI